MSIVKEASYKFKKVYFCEAMDICGNLLLESLTVSGFTFVWGGGGYFCVVSLSEFYSFLPLNNYNVFDLTPAILELATKMFRQECHR